MSRYIRLDDAVKVMACEMYAEAQSQGYDVDGIEDFMPEAKAWLNDAPSIDIVRCAECKHWHEHIDAKGQGRCDADEHNPFRVSIGISCADFFCSYGEREEER